MSDNERTPGTVYGIRPHKQHTWAEHDLARRIAEIPLPAAPSPVESFRRYMEALDDGLSEAEAREEGWPSR